MSRHPWVDTPSWDLLLAHRPPDVRDDVRRRFVESGVSPERVKCVLDDGGDALYGAAASGAPNWADPFGGPLSAALLAAEVSSLAAHLNSRSSAVRALAVNALLEDLSAVTVAARLGVSRQKVYEVSRAALPGSFIARVPWRQQ